MAGGSPVSGPDFIIAGAMRAGTTALGRALAEHPEIFMCTPKEPSFFAARLGSLQFCGPGDQGFVQENVGEWAAYQRLFDGAGDRVRGEASAMYLAVPGVASEIRARCPEVKLVFILRDPVERARSAWQYLRGRGRERLRDFTAALAAEDERRARGYGAIWWYVGASRYQVGLAEYVRTFPSSQLLVLSTEELRRDPAGTMLSVCRFLGVEGAHFAPSALASEVNRSGIPRVEVLTRLLYPAYPVRSRLARAAPPAVRQLVRRARAASTSGGDRMSPETRRWLQGQLADVAAEVNALTGLDTRPWQTGGGAEGVAP